MGRGGRIGERDQVPLCPQGLDLFWAWCVVGGPSRLFLFLFFFACTTANPLLIFVPAAERVGV